MQITVASKPIAPIALPSFPGLPGPLDAGINLLKLTRPPSPNSALGGVDLTFVKIFQRMRTEKGNEWANRLAGEAQVKLWVDLAKRAQANTGAVQGWLGTALLASSVATTAAVNTAAKYVFKRQRPYEIDKSITTVVPRPKSYSYPSGHTSAAYAAARVISKLAPELTSEAYDIAKQVALSRVYGGVHFPSDVVAGALLGTTVGDVAVRATKFPKR